MGNYKLSKVILSFLCILNETLSLILLELKVINLLPGQPEHLLALQHQILILIPLKMIMEVPEREVQLTNERKRLNPKSILIFCVLMMINNISKSYSPCYSPVKDRLYCVITHDWRTGGLS